MARESAVVSVLLGTDHHHFDRLVGWADRLGAAHEEQWFVQHGATPLPAHLTGAPMLTVDELQELLGRAAAVVTHGGPGLIMEARAAGHHPIVVPRDPGRGEHVDGHQQRFCARIARDGLISVADDLPTLGAAVDHELARGHRPRPMATAPCAAADRLGVLVEDLVAQRSARHARL